MKFKCGLTKSELAAREIQVQMRRISLCEWHKWFAWFPVKVDDGDCRWLEYVERRYRNAYFEWFDRAFIDYRAIRKLHADNH